MGFVQSNHAENSGIATTIATTLTVTGGNTILAGVTCDDSSTIVSVKDDLGNSFTSREAQDNTVFGQRLALFDLFSVTAGARTFTATFSPSSDFRGIMVEEVSGLSMFHAPAGTTGASTTPDSGAATSAVGDYCFGALQGHSNGPSFTGVLGLRVTDAVNNAIYGDGAATGSTTNATGTVSPSQDWTAVIATYTVSAGTPAFEEDALLYQIVQPR